MLAIMLVHEHSLARTGKGSKLIGFALLTSLCLLVVAWFLPIMTVTKLFVWSTKVSILDSTIGLWEESEYFVFAIVVLFSILFPLIKLLAGLHIWARIDATSAAAGRALGWLQWLGKWSMVDVFVVALVVVAIKVSLVSGVAVHAGVYVFSGAVGLSIVAMHFLEKAIERARAAADGAAPLESAAS